MPRRPSRCHRLELQLHPGEFSSIKDAAARDAINTAAWVRQVAVQSATRDDAVVRGPVKRIPELEAIIVEALAEAGKLADDVQNSGAPQNMKSRAALLVPQILAVLAMLRSHL